MRLQVFLSSSGVTSRRNAKKLIEEGKVAINGKKIDKASFDVDPEKDIVVLQGKKLKLKKKIYVMLNKPKGFISTKKDPFAEKKIIDLLPSNLRHLNPVGRLDKDTTGLLLFTNDGDLLNKLTHPSFEVKKTYLALLDKMLSGPDKKRLEKGIRLEDGYTAPCSIAIKRDNQVEIIIHEGRKRQVRRMFKEIGYNVIELERIREGLLELGGLKQGTWKFLTEKEVVDCNYKCEK
ncbi:MAG: pseudouridine synthase [Candidatus Omnitrophota bacterium]